MQLPFTDCSEMGRVRKTVRVSMSSWVEIRWTTTPCYWHDWDLLESSSVEWSKDCDPATAAVRALLGKGSTSYNPVV